MCIRASSGEMDTALQKKMRPDQESGARFRFNPIGARSGITAALAAALVFASASSVLADTQKAKKHYRRAQVTQHVPPVAPPSPYVGRLVTHPAWNIACMTRDRATRAIPCDQPVWVYGSPCEVDLGLGRYRPCD
jgi:hypothetical protein